MESNLTAEPVAEQPQPRFPYANWGPRLAIGGVLMALGTGIVLSVPGAVLGHKSSGDHLTTFG
ncbi:MAG: hypothetical protein ACTHK3_02115, partial [Solirubrobacterales bacterium]